MSDDIRSFELDYEVDDDLLLDDFAEELSEVAVALSQSTIDKEGNA
jgi:hypothetical protein